jgi:hypothetical protein
VEEAPLPGRQAGDAPRQAGDLPEGEKKGIRTKGKAPCKGTSGGGNIDSEIPITKPSPFRSLDGEEEVKQGAKLA